MRWLSIIISIIMLAACSGRPSTIRSSEKTVQEISKADTNAESFDLKVKKYEDPIRQSWQDPAFIMSQLVPLKGKVVADIGAGTGYFSFKIAALAKSVIAIDIDQQFLEYIEDRKFELTNKDISDKIKTRLTSPDNPGLLPGEADIVLMVNTITYIDDRSQYLEALKQGLTRMAKVVIVDYKSGEMPVGPMQEQKVTASELIYDLKIADFSIKKIDTLSLQYQYLIIATK